MAVTKFIYPKDKDKIEKSGGRFYIVSGTEPFLIDEFVENLSKKTSLSGCKPRVVYGDNLSGIENIGEISGGGDLFAEDYLYIIRNPEGINKKIAKQLSSAMRDVIETSGSSYIMVASDMRKISTHFKKIDGLIQVTCYRMFTEQIKQWIKSRVRERGFSINQKGVDLLFMKLGNDLKAIDGELEKLFLYRWDEKNIDEIAVEEMIVLSGANIETVGREITLFILSGKKKEALELFRRGISSGANCIMISTIISIHFRKLLYARAIIDEIGDSSFETILRNYLQIMNRDDYRSNMRKRELRESFEKRLEGFSGYTFGVENGIKLLADGGSSIDFFAYATLYSERFLLDKNSELFELDYRMKSGLVDFETGIEEFIFKV
jgi:DNA polymerase III delta subunit